MIRKSKLLLVTVLLILPTVLWGWQPLLERDGVILESRISLVHYNLREKRSIVIHIPENLFTDNTLFRIRSTNPAKRAQYYTFADRKTDKPAVYFRSQEKTFSPASFYDFGKQDSSYAYLTILLNNEIFRFSIQFVSGKQKNLKRLIAENKIVAPPQSISTFNRIFNLQQIVVTNEELGKRVFSGILPEQKVASIYNPTYDQRKTGKKPSIVVRSLKNSEIHHKSEIPLPDSISEVETAFISSDYLYLIMKDLSERRRRVMKFTLEDYTFSEVGSSQPKPIESGGKIHLFNSRFYQVEESGYIREYRLMGGRAIFSSGFNLKDDIEKTSKITLPRGFSIRSGCMIFNLKEGIAAFSFNGNRVELQEPETITLRDGMSLRPIENRQKSLILTCPNAKSGKKPITETFHIQDWLISDKSLYLVGGDKYVFQEYSLK